MASSSSVPSSPLALPSSPLPPLSSVNQTLTIKLNATNYLLWKAQLLNIVIANGMENILDGSLSPPSQFLDSSSSQLNPDFSTWQRYNRLLMSWIFSFISEDLLTQIVSLTTASDAWNALARIFASSSLAKITELRSQLHSVSKEGVSASAYIQTITNLCNTLAEIGEPVSYRDRMIYFLNGLGSEYNAFVVSITNRPDQPSLEEVHSLLQSFDFRLEKQNSVTSLPLMSQIAANAVNVRLPWSPRPPPPPSFRSSGAPGFQTSGNGLPYPHSPRPNRSFRACCQICHKTGHSAPACYHRLNPAYKPPAPAQSHSYPNPYPSHPHPYPSPAAHLAHQSYPLMQPNPPYPQAHSIGPFESQPQAFLTSPSPPISADHLHPSSAGLLPNPHTVSSSSPWLMDSGATHHLTPHASLLQHSQPYTGSSSVATADGSSLPPASVSGLSH